MLFFLHEYDVVNVIDDDDVANENDDDWVANKFVFVVMNEMVVEVNEHVSEMIDAFLIIFNSIQFFNKNTIVTLIQTHKKNSPQNGGFKLCDRFSASIQAVLPKLI